jgi:hypothetical protein
MYLKLEQSNLNTVYFEKDQDREQVITCFMLYSGQFPGVRILYADVSEHSVCSIFIGG